MTVGSVTYPAPGFKTSIVRIAPLLGSTVLTIAVACVPPAGGAVNDTVEAYKLGSFVTPYGKRLEMGGEKGWEWVYDLTDYAPLLRGKKRLRIGNNQELLDLKFEFIEGVPARNPISIQNIYPLGEYDGHYGYTYEYGDIVENKVLKPRKIDLSPAASHFSIKSIISGHGHEGPNYCCEWVEKSHYFFINIIVKKIFFY